MSLKISGSVGEWLTAERAPECRALLTTLQSSCEENICQGTRCQSVQVSCFLQHVCFVYSPNSHFWQPTTLLLLQWLLRLNSEIKSKSGKPWLHWNFQDENELAKLLKKQGVAILFLWEDWQFSLSSQTLDLLYKLLDIELRNLGIPWEKCDCTGILKDHVSLWYNVSCKKVVN